MHNFTFHLISFCGATATEAATALRRTICRTIAWKSKADFHVNILFNKTKERKNKHEMKQQKRRLVCACGKYANYKVLLASPSPHTVHPIPPLRRTTAATWPIGPKVRNLPQPDESCSLFAVRVERACWKCKWLPGDQSLNWCKIVMEPSECFEIIFVECQLVLPWCGGEVINCRLPRNVMAWWENYFEIA